MSADVILTHDEACRLLETVSDALLLIAGRFRPDDLQHVIVHQLELAHDVLTARGAVPTSYASTPTAWRCPGAIEADTASSARCPVALGGTVPPQTFAELKASLTPRNEP